MCIRDSGYGLLLACFGLLARSSEPPRTSLWSPVFFVFPLLLALLLLLPIRAYARRRVQEGP